MRYKTQREMDDRVERIVRAKVKHYYTDWKNYDRVKYMRCKGSKTDRRLILAVRETGTWLFNADTDKNYSIYQYVITYEKNRHDFYLLDLDRLEVTKLKEV